MSFLLMPAIVFIILIAVFAIQLVVTGKIAPKGTPNAGKNKPYACGEPIEDHQVQPDYSQFFPFAFFFTIMHVVALILATVPVSQGGSGYLIAGFFILSAAVALHILFRKND